MQGFVAMENPNGKLCDALCCSNAAAWMILSASAPWVCVCQSCYQRAMIAWAIEEVLELVRQYAQGGKRWHIRNGVDAFEVLGGYTQNPYLRAWIEWDNAGDGYQAFLRCWNARCG